MKFELKNFNKTALFVIDMENDFFKLGVDCSFPKTKTP